MAMKNKKPQKKQLFKRKTRQKINRTLLISLALITVYAVPFTSVYSTEPEQVKAGNGKVIVW